MPPSECVAAALALAAIATLATVGVDAHGRLVEPPSRASAWRYGFDTPRDYDDHQLYCGGFSHQWQRNGGRCGVCGDAWDLPVPRPHELGGRFGEGVLVRAYEPSSRVKIRVELTANHRGRFEFRLCDDPSEEEQACFDRHPLRRSDGGGVAFPPPPGNGFYDVEYDLPAGLECSHCVLQWRYIAGNNWGDCGNGTSQVGCGPQEEFRACADVSVGATAAIPSTRRPTGSDTPAPAPAPAPEPPAPGEPVGPLVALVALLAALAFFAVLVAHHFLGGRRLKDLLAKGKPTAPPAEPLPAPVRPPRTKRRVSPDGEDCEAPGFENVDLEAVR